MIALLEQLLHLTAKILFIVLKLFLVEADVGVAGHGQDAALLYAVRVEQRRQPAQKDVFRAYKALSVGEQQIRRRTVRNRHNTDGLVTLFAFQQCCGIQTLIDQMRHRMIGTDQDW